MGNRNAQNPVAMAAADDEHLVAMATKKAISRCHGNWRYRTFIQLSWQPGMLVIKILVQRHLVSIVVNLEFYKDLNKL